MKTSPSSNKDGSALISAVIFSSILALIVVPSYLKLSTATTGQSHRSYYNVAARNLAESGVEHAVWSLKQVKESNGSWNGWTIDGDDVTTKLTGFDFAGSTQGEVNVVILNYDSDSPEVITRARIYTQSEQNIDRYIHATLSASGGQGLFAYGMLTKEFIKASGGVAFDSWNSDPDNDSSTASVFYSYGVRDDNVSIATTGTQDSAISLGSSDVYGTAAIGSQSYSGLNVGWGGQVGPMDTNEWDSSDTQDLWKKDPPGWKVSLTTEALATGFSANFEEVTAPADANPTYEGAYQLPYTKQVLHGNQWSSWYQNEYVDEETIGAQGEVTVKQMNSLVVKAGATLRVEGDVMLILPLESRKTLEVIEGGAIELAEDARLVVYVAGDVDVTGAGIFNQLRPEQFQIWGTASTNQRINFLNNGQFSGTIYAPNADFRVTGDSDIYGAVVCKSIELTGSGSFHYDESLASLGGSAGGGGPTTVSYVKELIGEERATYIAKLDF